MPFGDDSPLTNDSPLAPGYSPPPPAPYSADTSPMAPETGARIGAAIEKENAAIDRAAASMEKESDLADQKAAALAPLRQRQMEYLTRPLPEMPKTEEPPKVPQRTAQDQKAAEEWMFASGLLGALAGAFTRNHATNALAAFGGAMEGYAQGNSKKFDQDMKTWEAENKRVLEHNTLVLGHYRQIMENRKLNMEQMSVELQLAAAQYDDQAMATAARSKNSLVIAKLYDKQAQSLSHMDRAGKQVQAGLAAAKQKELDEQALAYANSEEGLARARAIAALQLPPPPMTQRTGYEGAVNRHLMDKVLQISQQEFNRPYDAKQWFAGRIGAETPARAERAAAVARATIDPRAEGRTVIEFDVGRAGQSVQSLNVAIDHLDALLQLHKALQTNDTQFANRMQLWLAEAFGVSGPVNFDNAKNIVAQEVVKAIVPNAGSMQERREAAEGLRRILSPEQMEGTVATLQRLMAGQMAGLQKRYETGSHRTDFEEKLEDRTKQILGELRRTGVPNPANEMRDLTSRMGRNASDAWMNAARYLIDQTNRGEHTEISGVRPGARPPEQYSPPPPAPYSPHGTGSANMPMLDEGWQVEQVH